ncbi:SDR family NAD(P)-dependent oxidoreductase [Chitinimonas arctica]|uniref:SDR family NAD(P)-dependent oxidoreductase n=1 Tax=Chitinimonas arctica TaxID=2594795 RepID=A0A516SKM0_9NEIS|nr:SDR family NAD(P)-dependent oxidoreductase [Chitinimonas arctica]QDQ28700.1 SDR family NAD(P)-dependent oxidoreductase [Chitinimonas arctica]
MEKLRNLRGRVALVTGAAGGIGRALAIELAEHGCHLALADRNVIGLHETMACLRDFDVKVSIHEADVCVRSAADQLPEQVAELHGRMDLLFNNAGVAVGGYFEEVSAADFDWLFEVNFGAVVRLTRASLPRLRKSDDSCIVNTSSLLGLISPSGQVAYNASSFAIRGFSMALAHELAGSTVGVTVAQPGCLANAIVRNARIPVDSARPSGQAVKARQFLKLSPESAAKYIVRAVTHRKKRVLVGSDAYVLGLLGRFLPAHYWGMLQRFA